MWTPLSIVKGKEDKYKGQALPGCPPGSRHCMSETGYLTEKIWDAECVDWIVEEVNLTRGDTRRWHMLPQDGAGPHQFCWKALKRL